MNTMDKATRLKNALSALGTAVERYDCMGWFDGDEGQMAEAKEMTDAVEAGDKISVGVALDRAMERYDLMGANTCEDCGQDYPESGCVHVPCECGNGPDTLGDEAIEIKKALEDLRTEETPEPKKAPKPLLAEMTPAVKQLLGVLKGEIERQSEFQDDEGYQENAARMQGFVDALEGRDDESKYEYPLTLAYQGGQVAAYHLKG